MAILSLLGLYQTDKSLFDAFSLPADVDKTALTNQLLMECAELEILYPSGPALKDAIAMWSAAQVNNWTRLANIYKLEYNPIENYDRNESWQDGGTVANKGSAKNDSTISNTQTGSGSDKPNIQVQDNVWGFNSTTTVPKSNQITSGSTDTTSNSTSNTSGGSTGSSEQTETRSLTKDGHVHGNIGVTTSQQMIESEIALWDRFNIYTYIVNQFKQRFCLLIY